MPPFFASIELKIGLTDPSDRRASLTLGTMKPRFDAIDTRKWQASQVAV